MTKEEKEKLETEYISEFETHFINQKLDPNNPEEIEYIKQMITNVVRLEIEELGFKLEGEEKAEEIPYELEFVNNPNSEFDGIHVQDENKIKIVLNTFVEGLGSDNIEHRQLWCMQLFETLFHEIQHQRQEMLAKLNISCKEASLYAKEFVLVKKHMKFYKGINYSRFSIENNAEFMGFNTYIQLIRPEDRYVYLMRDHEYNLSKIYTYIIDEEDGTKSDIEREDFFEDHLPNAEFLEIYPILSKEYKPALYGNLIQRRSSIELIRNMQSELDEISKMGDLTEPEKQKIYKDTTEFYYEMIYRSLYQEIPQDIDQCLKNKCMVWTVKSSKCYTKAFSEEFRKIGSQALYNEDKIIHKAMEYYGNECLINIINYLGIEGFKNFIRRNENIF